MIKTKVLAPVVAIAVSFTLLVMASLSIPANGAGEIGSNYFIKPVVEDRVLVVEPNLLGFVRSGLAVDESGQMLFSSLNEIAERYIIQSTQLVKVERNSGRLVPNLFVYVQPSDAVTASIEASSIAPEL
ncbi:hypothetical protein IQ268_10580 [Oculatella sp. LEGE 06141]|uniref:hypothetical protein n=1 Tax=Oculatella sp. LEGE 06141 TaxID=1828648 RepID=UPI001880FC06|nr:hypothetical protein [Oculatella sp. LEGE 06141]MBE9179005.1 hypothetical protein [Oculatella sp. LEGE 06141]